MELEHSFTVPLPEERAWEVLLDVERVAPCMPGATLDSVDGDDIKGRIKVKVGPIAMTYAGTAHFTERDPAGHVITLEASGKETRGAGTASAKVRSTLESKDGETQVTVHTTLNVTGRPAQFGRGVMAEVGGKLIGIFASNLADMLAADRQQTADEDAGDDPEGDLVGVPADRGDLDQTIDVLNLPLRSYNGLRRAGIDTVADLTAKTGEDLLSIENIGPASVEEIRQKLALLGLTLSDSPASRNGLPGATAADAPSEATADSAPASTPGRPRTDGSGSRGVLRDASYDDRASDDAIDLLGVAGLPVLKRALPVAVAVAAAAVIALRIRSRIRGRRRSRS